VMNKEAFDCSYYAWYPVLESTRDVVSVLLTPAQCQQAPLSGKAFAARLLSAVGLNDSYVSFGCDEFVTCYFQQHMGNAHQFQECWDLRILLPQKMRKRRLSDLVAWPVAEMPESVGEGRTQLPFRVLADFESRQRRVECKKALQERALAQSISWPDRYAIRDVGPHRQQLCVDVGTTERSRMNELFADAAAIMKVCEEFKGRIFASVTRSA
jgi:hypothetical protein